MRIHHHHRPLDVRHLPQLKRAVFGFLDINHVAFRQHVGRLFRRLADPLVFERLARPRQTLQPDGSLFAAFGFNPGFRGACRKHDRLLPAFFRTCRQNRFFQCVLIVAVKVYPCRCPAEPVPPVIIEQSAPEHFGRQLLQRRVNCRAHHQPAFKHRIFAEALGNNAPHLVAEILAVFQISEFPLHRYQRLFLRRLGLFPAHVPVFRHTPDNPVAPRNRRVVALFGIVVVRPFRQRRQIGGFFKRQLRQRFVEIIESRRRHAVCPVAEVNLVQIQLQNVLFGKCVADAVRQNGLLDFADKRPLRRKQKVFRHLLRNRRRPDQPFAFGIIDDIRKYRARNPQQIYPRMRIKMLVFGSDKSLLDPLGNFILGHENTLLRRIFHQHLPVAGIQARRNRRLVCCQLRIVGNIKPGRFKPNKNARKQQHCHQQPETDQIHQKLIH